ncbi:A24 family peptidase [Anaerocolumna chitinilytica]|uniref:Prepilin type IV endopeptidase peptidase domain-containing protein n=1 Tax=Anaerocolumna chitinilytica TaxID=1727145 RepID=A0A7I8DI17_9FIRM|nr:prepilin peptidase [Anaerocolumna chitinilytica]BCJ97004.1 hypothetical protein bsdcttw_00450 [Anaerocolumna chitinilytica]
MRNIDYRFFCILALLAVAIREDFKSYKIPNYLAVIGITVSFATYMTEHGTAGILFWFLGILFPFLILFPLFLIRAVGAGDIKLFCVIGGFYGIAFGFQIILLSFLTAAFFSIILIIRKGQFQKRLFVLKNYIRKLYLAKEMPEKEPNWYHYYDRELEKNVDNGVLHFSVSILVGFVISVLLAVFFPGLPIVSLFSI